jgi:hypothetical protein
MHIDGKCHCGAISFEAEADPARVVACHCTDCQIFSGSSFRVGIMVPVADFHLTGEPRRYIKVADSGNRRLQASCPTCGTLLFGTAPENPTTVAVLLGWVRQRAQLRPAQQVWQRSASPWLADLPSIPGCMEQSPP